MSVHIYTKIEHFQQENIRKELEVLTDIFQSPQFKKHSRLLLNQTKCMDLNKLNFEVKKMLLLKSIQICRIYSYYLNCNAFSSTNNTTILP